MSFVMTTRRIEKGEFGFKQGQLKYLDVPKGVRAAHPDHEIRRSNDWFKAVAQASMRAGTDSCGRVIILVHGYNVSHEDMLARHRKIAKGLKQAGLEGVCVSFDWPSDGNVAGYLPDRRDARWAASFLMEGAVAEFSKRQEPDCKIDVCIVAHSMGCYVVREAFDFADGEHQIAQNNWTVSQVAFVAADISQSSMKKGDSESRSLLRHLTRLTNYWSPHDEILSISSTKRIGASRRLGRVGLPLERDDKTVNLFCGDFFDAKRDTFEDRIGISHNWYFDSSNFYSDLSHTLNGSLDRTAIPGRILYSDGSMGLKA